MPKPIDLSARINPQATPPQKEKKPDPSGQVPVNRMPLPAGTIMKTDNPSLTPSELAGLQQLGWKEGDPLPADVSEAQALMRQQASEQLPPPVPEGTKMRIAETVNIADLPPEEQARIMAEVKQAATQQQQRKPASPPPAAPPADLDRDMQNLLKTKPAAAAREPVSFASQAVPGWVDPDNPNYRPQAYVTPPQASQPAQHQSSDDLLQVDLASEPPRPEPQPAPEPEPEPETEPERKSEDAPSQQTESTLNTVPQECPHCHGDLSLPPIAEPSHVERQQFLQSVLGQIQFVKDYAVMGGNVRMRFRTLTTPEIDLIYKQVYHDRNVGKVMTQADFWEAANRYRICLQLLRLEGRGEHGFLEELPDGYNNITSPNCEATWTWDPEMMDGNPTALPQIEQYIYSNVLRTETMQRMVHRQCLKFNELVAKLEALVDDSDFWKPTGSQS